MNTSSAVPNRLASEKTPTSDSEPTRDNTIRSAAFTANTASDQPIIGTPKARNVRTLVSETASPVCPRTQAARPMAKVPVTRNWLSKMPSTPRASQATKNRFNDRVHTSWATEMSVNARDIFRAWR